MPNEPLNTQVLQNLINQIKSADMSRQKEIKIDISTAKNISYTLAILLARLAGNYEDIIKKVSQTEEIVTVNMDGGDWSKK